MMGIYLLLVVLCVSEMMTSHVFGDFAVNTSLKKLCEEPEIVLREGLESSVLVSLDPNLIQGECRVTIKAPQTYVVHMTIVEIPSPPYIKFRNEFPPQPSCNMSVFQIDSIHKPVWNGDMCSNGLLRNVDLLNPEITLLWHQPTEISSTHNRKLLFTAVGLGDVCKRKDQHTCMSIGHKPLFCISDQLICDGYQNCPKGATKSDEDTHLCNRFNNFNNLQLLLKDDTFAENILKSLRRTSEKPLINIPKMLNTQNDKTTTTPQPEEDKPTTALESISMTLSQYGPWGYILLGMLLCAAVLMFCGVIECLRKPKPAEPVQSTPTTVLIINNQQDDATPPRYEDLDPPSYNTLFPNAKEDDENSIHVDARRNSSMEIGNSNQQSTSSEQNDSTERQNGETSFSLQNTTQTESQT